MFLMSSELGCIKLTSCFATLVTCSGTSSPLDMIKAVEGPHVPNIIYGQTILIKAVLAILIITPIGVLLIHATKNSLLVKNDAATSDASDSPTTEQSQYLATDFSSEKRPLEYEDRSSRRHDSVHRVLVEHPEARNKGVQTLSFAVHTPYLPGARTHGKRILASLGRACSSPALSLGIVTVDSQAELDSPWAHLRRA